MCICNNHGDCEGVITQADVLKNFCPYNCHDNSYQLVRNSIASNNMEKLGNFGTNQNFDY